MRRLSVAAIVVSALVAACGWDPSRPFDRESPQVNEALSYYDAGRSDSAAELLQDYLATGACKEGNIGTPLRVRERPSGSFDLGLSLFKLAETYGQRFGDEENDAGALDPNLKGLRAGQVECALRIVRAIAEDPATTHPLRARARYLEGNLLFLTAAYKEAVSAYDHALEIVPAMGDGGPIGAAVDAGSAPGHVAYAPDPVARDAAWNRAVALRRIQDQKDAGNDAAPPDGGGDGGNDKNDDGGKDDKNDDAGKTPDAGDGNDKNKDAGKTPDAGDEDEKKKPPKSDPPDAGPPPPPEPPSRQSQDDRILDQLENAPTVQQQTAKQRAKARKVRGMADK